MFLSTLAFGLVILCLSHTIFFPFEVSVAYCALFFSGTHSTDKVPGNSSKVEGPTSILNINLQSGIVNDCYHRSCYHPPPATATGMLTPQIARHASITNANTKDIMPPSVPPLVVTFLVPKFHHEEGGWYPL